MNRFKQDAAKVQWRHKRIGKNNITLVNFILTKLYYYGIF